MAERERLGRFVEVYRFLRLIWTLVLAFLLACSLAVPLAITGMLLPFGWFFPEAWRLMWHWWDRLDMVKMKPPWGEDKPKKFSKTRRYVRRLLRRAESSGWDGT